MDSIEREAESLAETPRALERAVRQKPLAGKAVWLTCLAAGAGGGLGLGVLRACSAWLVREPVLTNALAGAAMGAWVSFALWWGLWLAARAFVEPPRTFFQKFLAVFSTLAFGGAAFGLAASLISLLAGTLRLPGGWMALVANLEAGVCLALALIGCSIWRAGIPLHFPYGLWRVLAAGSLYVALHYGFVHMRISHLSAVVIWPGAVFREEPDKVPEWLRGMAGFHWHDALALLDAFMAGALLCAGIMAGLRLADWLSGRR